MVITDIFLQHLPNKRKKTPSGWISFNAPCCHHNGHRMDNRGRGGFLPNADGSFSYHCFNCGYKCSWQTGRNLSNKTKKFLSWINVNDETITKLSLEILRQNEGLFGSTKLVKIPDFITTLLPESTKNISQVDQKLIRHVLSYIDNRSLSYFQNNLYWSSQLAYKDRLIIPFTFKKNIVGYTARSVKKNKVKYLTSSQPGYVYGYDSQTVDKKFAIVCEGPIDAIHTQGLATLGSEINQQQILLINSLQKEIICVPDRDKAGKNFVEIAIDNGWAISMPPWADTVKDVGDAVDKYGRILTLNSIIKYKQHTTLKIKLGAKKWFGNNI